MSLEVDVIIGCFCDICAKVIQRFARGPSPGLHVHVFCSPVGHIWTHPGGVARGDGGRADADRFDVYGYCWAYCECLLQAEPPSPS